MEKMEGLISQVRGHANFLCFLAEHHFPASVGSEAITRATRETVT